MFKKLSVILVGVFCTGLLTVNAAEPKLGSALTLTPKIVSGVAQPTLNSTQEKTSNDKNTDRFNFVIANPNTVDPKKFLFEIKPGEQAQDYVYVKNASDVELKFKLYGADGTKSNQGSFALKTKDQAMENLGKWVTFEKKELILEPGETEKVKFTVAIPQGTPEGTYSGGVAAEKSAQDGKNPNITIAVRIALRADVKVTSNPQPIPKKYNDVGGNPFFQAYFWASLGLFVLSAGALAWSYFKEKSPNKSKKHKKTG